MVRRKKHYRKVFRKHPKLTRVLKVSLGVFLFLVLIIAFLFLYYSKDLPRPEIFSERPFVLPTKIYDREGETLLYQIYGEEKRTMVSLDQVSDYLKQAVLVAEDVNFYHHFGLDFKGIFRAILKNLKSGKPIYGGSTISQQLIRSSSLTLEKTLQRKIREIILTIELERRWPKDQILEWYLNQVPFGANAYGVEEAAQTYFKKPAADLTLEESALLASLIRAPSYLSPYGEHQQELLARKDYIIERMNKAGYISQEEAKIAKAEPVEFSMIPNPIKAPHFAIYIRNYLEEKYSDYFLQEKGLKVYTTLDWELQEWAEKVVKEGVERNKDYNAHNATLVAINPKNGEVLAMVGSANWYATSSYPEGCSASPDLNCQFDPKVNVAMYGQGQQPGSAFKPFAYSIAFKKGFGPENILWDVKTEFNPDCTSTALQKKDQFGLDCYHPKNYDEKFRGQVTFREALAQSINLPSVKVLYLAGLKDTIDLAKKMGITTLDKPAHWYGLPLVLGGVEVKLLDMVSAYSVFATEGLKTSPVFILRIEDSEGSIIEENKKTQKRVLGTQIARLINDILSDNKARAPLFGWHSSLYFPDQPVAVKTGTTQDYRDAWTVGYTSSIVAGVWAGNNDNSSTGEKPGLVLAAPIWHQFMEKALELYPGQDFTEPELTEAKELPPEEPHSILDYIREKPELDPQYQNWEEAIKFWLETQ